MNDLLRNGLAGAVLMAAGAGMAVPAPPPTPNHPQRPQAPNTTPGTTPHPFW
jgi:hypothetical protein